jgi:hypothetical protein
MLTQWLWQERDANELMEKYPSVSKDGPATAAGIWSALSGLA